MLTPAHMKQEVLYQKSSDEDDIALQKAAAQREVGTRWWSVRGYIVQLVECLRIYRTVGGVFEDISAQREVGTCWWSVRGYIIQLVECLRIYCTVGGVFEDISYSWWSV